MSIRLPGETMRDFLSRLDRQENKSTPKREAHQESVENMENPFIERYELRRINEQLQQMGKPNKPLTRRQKARAEFKSKNNPKYLGAIDDTSECSQSKESNVVIRRRFHEDPENEQTSFWGTVISGNGVKQHPICTVGGIRQ